MTLIPSTEKLEKVENKYSKTRKAFCIKALRVNFAFGPNWLRYRE